MGKEVGALKRIDRQIFLQIVKKNKNTRGEPLSRGERTGSTTGVSLVSVQRAP